MNRTLSPQQTKIALLVALLLISAIGFWLLVMRQSADTTTPVAVPTHSAPKAPAAPTHAAPKAPAAPAHAAPKAPAAPTRAAKAPGTPARTSSPHRVAKPSHTAHRLATHGLPVTVAEALKKHSVVVVALYTPGVELDRLARAEYAAAASAGGAGFVSLNVLRQRDGGPLLTKLGLLEAPAVLVIKRPSRVFVEIEGFADRHTVLQAVANAKR